MRPYDEEPMSRAAQAAQGIALFSVPVAVIAVLVARSGKIGTLPALAAVGSGLCLALFAIVLAFVAFAVIWVSGSRGGKAALLGLVMGAGVLAYPAYSVVKGVSFPAIHDITTDVADPPVLTAALLERGPDDNPLDYGGERVAIIQLSAYPEIVPVTLDLGVPEVHTLVLQVMRDRGWRVIAGETFPAKAAQVQIEAVASSLVLGLKTDVAVRIRATGRGSRIDMRSNSRFGRRDLGSNAALVRDFLSDMTASTR